MHVNAVYLRPAYRARHLAAAIYLYLAKLARSRGYNSILGLVQRSNEALLGLYRAAGSSFTEYVMCELKRAHLPEELIGIPPLPAQASS